MACRPAYTTDSIQNLEISCRLNAYLFLVSLVLLLMVVCDSEMVLYDFLLEAAIDSLMSDLSLK